MSKSDKIKETHNFDLKAQKKPRRSTLYKQLKIADSLLNAENKQNTVIEFDRIKFAVNLNKYGRYINFEIINLEETKYPYLTPYKREVMKHKELLYKYINVNEHNLNPDNEQIPVETSNNRFNIEENIFDENDEDILDELENKLNEDEEDESGYFIDLYKKIQEASSEERNERILEAKEEYDFIHKNYAIDYDTYKNTIGLNDVVVKHRTLMIDVTGKFMASAGNLGKIHVNNINELLQKLIDLHLVKFDINKLIEVAHVYSVDVCVDIDCGNKEKVQNIIEGVSSLFPIATSLHQIYKYGRNGLLLTRKKRHNGEALTFYHKGEELSYRNNGNYQNTIGTVGVELANKTLRLEYKLYQLENIRSVLDIKSKDFAIVRLSDVLNSTEKPLLKALKSFEAEPNVLKERIYGWYQNEQDIDNGISEKSLTDILLAERYVELLVENNYDIIKTRNHIKTEYSGLVSKDTIKKFNTLANSRDYIMNFLIYRKPKSVTIILELLKKVYEYYGMDVGGADD